MSETIDASGRALPMTPEPKMPNRGNPTDSHAFWRERAEQLRGIANATTDDTARTKLLKVAGDYEQMVALALNAQRK